MIRYRLALTSIVFLLLLLLASAPGTRRAWASEPPPLPHGSSSELGWPAIQDAVRPAPPSDHARTLHRRPPLARYCIASAQPCPHFWYQDYFRPRTSADRWSLRASTLLAVSSPIILAAGSREFIGRSSDVGQIILPTTAVAMPALQGDWTTTRRALLVFGTAMVITHAGKYAFKKTRPDGKDTKSYPSGHTAAAFSGAAFLYNQYGPRIGIPAYLIAVHTGIARVSAERHFLDDVIAGAGIGIFSAALWDTLADRRCGVRERYRRHARWRLEFGWGGVRQTDNDTSWPEDRGTEFNLVDWDKGGDLRPTSRLTIQWFPSARHQVLLRVDPTEIRARRTLDEPLTFGTVTFPVGTDVAAEWLGEEYKLRWSYLLNPRKCRFALRAGATILMANYEIELESEDDEAGVGSVRFIPLPHLEAQYAITSKLQFLFTTDGVPYVDYTGFDMEAVLRYVLPRRWDVGLLYRRTHRFTTEKGIDNDPVTHGFYLTLGRSF